MSNAVITAQDVVIHLASALDEYHADDPFGEQLIITLLNPQRPVLRITSDSANITVSVWKVNHIDPRLGGSFQPLASFSVSADLEAIVAFCRITLDNLT